DRVEHVTLEGLTIWGSLFTDAYRSGGYSTGPEASGNRPGEEDREGLVQMENASHITVRDCTLYNAGHCCVNMGYYASHNTLQGNAISDCGSYGVLLVGKDNGEGVVDDPSEQIYDNNFHTLYNNHIHHCGVLAGDTAGIYLYQSGDNDIAHNLIHGMPRYGIGMKGHGGLYGKYTAFGNVTITDDNYWDFYTGNHNTIRHNHVYDLLEDSYDAGGISLRRSGLHNVIDHNRIHDVHPPTSMDYHFCFGIYLDGGTSYTDITHNVIYDIGSNGVGYPIKMKKVYNTVTNNILVLEAGTNGTLAMQEGGGGQPESAGYGYHTVTRNILYAKGEAAVVYWFKSEDEFDCDLVGTSDYNLFFLPDGGPYTFQSIPGADNFANWKTLCGGAYDQNTVTQNPLFVDVANDDYNLSPNSPAYDIGFVEIDQSLAGLVGADYILVDHLVATTGGASGEIDLTWDAVSGASSYTVKRSTTSGAAFSAIGTTSEPAYTDTALSQGTRYYYKVSAVIDGHNAPNSRETSASPGTVLFSDDFESGDL
ncbi:MAG: right-handed parallel beta-helix repeat-containing protein, partial [Myxococcota bacterium]|nr:right-handed parallel beta-helix repeat-containing protein [Myxococcota bacterium]